ncbi:hypothetical protein PISMIDRAFT_676581 [Pisolithus microcarpus 441]|uniref:Uncharacterized protein n=1 Tax=Pisolithus microcarpus 441 TaxID=765257 RepID=A0A0C9YM46_9AGAM|nr:hypothetical protein PISMIDRAFT_676581 [Pisolithus microcarpus 441]
MDQTLQVTPSSTSCSRLTLRCKLLVTPSKLNRQRETVVPFAFPNINCQPPNHRINAP